MQTFGNMDEQFASTELMEIVVERALEQGQTMLRQMARILGEAS